jgi:hypothetical protein
MTIGIIGFGELSGLPYLGRYADVLRAEGVIHDIIYWNREHLSEDSRYACRHLYKYDRLSPMRRSRARKFVDFLGYRGYLLRLLRENQYDRLIVLTTLPAILLSGLLTRRYAGRYVFDVRDYAYEQIPPFYSVEKAVVRSAALCVSSSPGFLSWLPPAAWKISHNVDGSTLRDWLGRETPPPRGLFKRPVRVLRFIGHLRYPRATRAVIDQLGGDSRFEVHYHGHSVMSWDATAYARGKGATNVQFHGRYQPEHRAGFYEDCDLVLSNYDTASTTDRTALNNKLYESALALRPILVSSGTYLGEVVTKHALGLAVDAHRESLRDAIDRYAAAFDPAAFAQRCRGFLTQVLHEDEEFVGAVRTFARGT